MFWGVSSTANFSILPRFSFDLSLFWGKRELWGPVGVRLDMFAALVPQETTVFRGLGIAPSLFVTLTPAPDSLYLGAGFSYSYSERLYNPFTGIWRGSGSGGLSSYLGYERLLGQGWLVFAELNFRRILAVYPEAGRDSLQLRLGIRGDLR